MSAPLVQNENNMLGVMLYIDHFIVDMLVEKWSPVIVPLYGQSSCTFDEFFGLGSAFLVAAKHVLDDIVAHEVVAMNLAGKPILIRWLGFKFSREHDLAVAELSDPWLINEGLKKIIKIPLIREDRWDRIGVYLLAGYPASSNKLKPRYKQTNRKLFSITANLHPNEVESNIKNAITFYYNPKKAVNSENINPGGKPPLYGMSGGPVFEVVFNRHTNQYSVVVAGVLCECKKEKRAIVAAPASAVIELIEQLPKLPPK